MSTQPKSYLTPEQYLEIERLAEIKSEYFAGEMFAMPVANSAHCLINASTVGALGNQCAVDRRFYMFGSDMRLLVSATGLYTYPDVSVVCGKPEYDNAEKDVLLNPCMIAEVFSPSTEAYDRGRKFQHYRTIPSLLQYVLIASECVQADVFTRGEDGVWRLFPADRPDDELNLSSIGCNLRLRSLYAQTDLAQEKTY